MFIIGCLMNPLANVVTLSKYIKLFNEKVRSSKKDPNYLAFFALYIFFISIFGIYRPLQTLYHSRLPKHISSALTNTENVKRIIAITNATRNYLLATFSLFFLLVTWRLLDLILFSARLHEFSDLMGHYNLVDVDVDKDEYEDDTVIGELIDELDDEEEEDSDNWPVVVQLNAQETLLLKKFLEEASHAFPTSRLESLLVVPEQIEEENENTEDSGPNQQRSASAPPLGTNVPSSTPNTVASTSTPNLNTSVPDPNTTENKKPDKKHKKNKKKE